METHCVYCGKSFNKNKSWQLYCSKKCSKEICKIKLKNNAKKYLANRKIKQTIKVQADPNYWKKIYDKRYRILHEEKCIICGNLFITSSKKNTCSQKCNKESELIINIKHYYKLDNLPNFMADQLMQFELIKRKIKKEIRRLK